MQLRSFATRCAILLSISGIAFAGTLSGFTAPFTFAAASAPVQLTLHLPQASYPRDALVQTTVGVRNMSKDVVWLNSFHACGQSNPNVVDLDAYGHAFPAIPNTPYDIPAGCPVISPTPNTPGILRPGQSLTSRVYVVLHADHLLADAYVSIYHGCVPWTLRRCHATAATATSHAQVHLIQPTTSPRLVLHRGTTPWIGVEGSTRKGLGPVLYTGSYACWNKASGSTGGLAWSLHNGTGDPHWGATGSTRINLPFGKCLRLILHVAAGRPGQSVGTLNYMGPNQ